MAANMGGCSTPTAGWVWQLTQDECDIKAFLFVLAGRFSVLLSDQQAERVHGSRCIRQSVRMPQPLLLSTGEVSSSSQNKGQV